MASIVPVESKRALCLDLIKLISCIAVVGPHTLRSGTYPASTIVYQLCAVAVPCFLMSSG